jgi:hypothetical protein
MQLSGGGPVVTGALDEVLVERGWGNFGGLVLTPFCTQTCLGQKLARSKIDNGDTATASSQRPPPSWFH